LNSLLNSIEKSCMVNKCSSTHEEFTTVFFRSGSLTKKKSILLNLPIDLVHKLIIKNSRKKRLKTVHKRCSLADRKRCQVNGTVKRSVIQPYLYCKLISVHEKYRVSVKQPFFNRLLPFTDRPCVNRGVSRSAEPPPELYLHRPV
jgi:hypothetical protein